MITPEELMLNDEASVPDREYVRLSFSGSEADTVTTLVSFSSLLKLFAKFDITGGSFTFVIFIVID